MLRTMSWPQFLEWVAFSELEPFDEERTELRFASIVAAIFNVNRDVKKRRKPFEPKDVVMRFGDTPGPARPQRSWQQLKALGLMCFKFFGGGKDVDEKKPKVRRPSRRIKQ